MIVFSAHSSGTVSSSGEVLEPLHKAHGKRVRNRIPYSYRAVHGDNVAL